MSPTMLPNILLITTDQHNAEILGCAGNPVVQTPNLDLLAAEGLICDAAFTPHPLSSPARTSLLTGLHGQRHGVTYNISVREGQPDPPEWSGLAAEVPAFPALLAGRGYATALFGKLHTRQEQDARFGFQTLRLAEGKGQFVSSGSGLDDYRKFLQAKGYAPSIWRTWELPAYRKWGYVTSPLPLEDHIDTWTANEAVTYLEQVSQPFFAWVSFSGPHTPWDPPEPYASMYDPAAIPMPVRRHGELEEKHPMWVERVSKTIPALPQRSIDPDAEGSIKHAYERLSNAEIRAMLAAYYGEISHIDAQVGRVLKALDVRGLAQNTLVVFTADHGDYLGNNWAFYKYSAPYDSLVRVPFIVRWPNRIAVGGHRHTLVSLLDLAPTFLEAAGAEAPYLMDGRSLLPMFAGQTQLLRDSLFVEAGRVQGVITPEWLYIRWQDGFEELYNRQADPHNLYNLALRPENAFICRRLAARMTIEREEFGEPSGEAR